MKIEDWYSIYNNAVRRVTREIKYCRKSGESFDDQITCLILCSEDFDAELFEYLQVNNEFKLTYYDWSELCHKYINAHKKVDTYVAEFFFGIWVSGQKYFNDFIELTLTLNEYSEFTKDATKEEIEFARKHFSTVTHTIAGKEYTSSHTFSDDAKVLEYRNVRFIIDNEWNNAWYYHNGKEYTFSLDYDWWYPIDRFISLES